MGLQKILGFVVLAVVVSAIAGATASFIVYDTLQHSESALIKDFYLTENAVLVSPHSLRGKMDKGADGYVLVDLRSKEEYEKEHIIGAVNIPAYANPNKSYDINTDKAAKEEIIKKFSELPKDKDIVVYCYSAPCMTGRKVGKLLAENGIYIKHLGIGWNEWRYFWNMWNHEHEWDATDVMDYIASGPEPGAPKVREPSKACGLGELSC